MFQQEGRVRILDLPIFLNRLESFEIFSPSSAGGITHVALKGLGTTLFELRCSYYVIRTSLLNLPSSYPFLTSLNFQKTFAIGIR